MKHYIARYYRDKNGTLQDVAIDWSHRKPIEIDRGIVRGIDMCNVVYRGSRDLHDELFDLCNDNVRAYISQNSRMTDAVPCEIRLVSYKAISDSSEYEWHFNITLCTDYKDWAQTVKSELNADGYENFRRYFHSDQAGVTKDSDKRFRQKDAFLFLNSSWFKLLNPSKYTGNELIRIARRFKNNRKRHGFINYLTQVINGGTSNDQN